MKSVSLGKSVVTHKAAPLTHCIFELVVAAFSEQWSCTHTECIYLDESVRARGGCCLRRPLGGVVLQAVERGRCCNESLHIAQLV